MIDSISVYLPDARAPLDRLDGVRPLRGEGTYSGRLDGLRIIQGRTAVFIQGSLPKYLRGQNTLPLTRQTFRDALGKLEGQTGLDLKAGLVYRLEIADTLPVKEAPVNYLASWGPVPRCNRHTWGNGQTVTYATRTRSFSGYDKGAETAPDGMPEPLGGVYGLRLELSIKKGMRRLMGHVVNPWDLTEPETYGQLVQAWGRFYFRIPKRREVVLNMEKMTPKKYERTLAALGLAALGLDRAESIVRSGVQAGQVDKLTASRIRARLRELNADRTVTIGDALTEEVDAQVRGVMRFAR